ncbi:MAG: pentapeptide repeat-containing protein [Armatimonadetes bacterium]|nr:pentapeptide repeat-containing protein [Armatimonadota bacterium]
MDFTGADLRDTSYNSTVFVNCLFRNTRLTKVEFWGSNFTDCVFEGELREVIFSRDGLPRGQNPPNEMINVDLRKAKLRMCGFRKLNLDRVLFPEDDEHIILDQYPETVDRLLEQLAARTESGWLGVAGLLEWDQKCVGPRQRFGVWSKQDIVAEVGEDGLSEFLGWVQAWGVPRSAQEVNAMDPKDRLLP